MHPSKYLFAAAVLVTLGAGCKADTAEAPAAKRAPAAKVEDSIFIVEGMPVTMNDGYAEEAPTADAATKTVTRIFGVPVPGDLDGDGDLDAAVILSRDPQASGTFYYVVASIKEDWGYRGTEAYPLGDRIAPQTLEIKDGVIIANFAVRAEGDPMTTPPSIGVSNYYRIEDGEMTSIENPEAQTP